MPGAVRLHVESSLDGECSSSCLAGLLSFALDDLLLEDGGLGETERDLVSGQLVVAVDDGIKLVFHELDIEGVEEHDVLSAAVSLDAEGALADVGGENL